MRPVVNDIVNSRKPKRTHSREDGIIHRLYYLITSLVIQDDDLKMHSRAATER